MLKVLCEVPFDPSSQDSIGHAQEDAQGLLNVALGVVRDLKLGEILQVSWLHVIGEGGGATHRPVHGGAKIKIVAVPGTKISLDREYEQEFETAFAKLKLAFEACGLVRLDSARLV